MPWLARLGTTYSNLGQTDRAADTVRKAYELRERVSEREKFDILSHYQALATGDLANTVRTCELWAQTYPRDSVPPGNLGGSVYWQLGQYEKALASSQQALKLDPGSGISYANVVGSYLYLGRLDEAKTTAEEDQAHNLDNPILHFYLYLIAFLRHDTAGMQNETTAVMGKAGVENLMLYLQSDTAAYARQFAKGRALMRQAADSAERADEKETAAYYQAEAALHEALVGNVGIVKERAAAALRLSNGRDVEYLSAIALELVNDVAQAEQPANDLAKRFPEDTIAQYNYLPTIRAVRALRSNNAAKAIELLEASSPYELGVPNPTFTFSLYPIYVRGAAYLAAHQGSAAVSEFKKIVDHPGVAVNQPIGALAHLQLGRAYALAGERGKAPQPTKTSLPYGRTPIPTSPS